MPSISINDLQFAARFEGITGSAIREIFKLIAQPGMISFAGGNPSAAMLEDALIADIARDVLLRDGKRILQYGGTEGWPALREQVSAFLAGLGVAAAPEAILPTTGSTQGLDLLLKALVNPGDTVLAENPSFLGAFQAMRLYPARIVPVATDADGVIPEALEEAIRAHRPKLIYLIPTFQNPTGVTLTLERRKAVAALAAKYGVPLSEDDPYRDLRYRGEALPPIHSFDDSGFVVYLISFSKLIAPGMRVGAVTAPPALLRKLTIGKQSADTHMDQLAQAIVAEYLARGLLPGHLETLRSLYGAQLSRMLAHLDGMGLAHTVPEGGLFIWAKLPEGMDALQVLEKAVERRVAFVPGTHFYADGGHPEAFRLNFSNSSLEQIDQGMAALAETLRG